jgi:Domain of unknown function (DUF5658)
MRSEVRSPAPATIATPVEPHVEPLDAPSRRRTVRVALLATAVGLLAFLVIQALLAAYNLGVMRDAVDRGWLDVSRSDPSRNLLMSLGYGALSYLVISFTGSAIAGRGHRFLFVLPASALIFVSVLPSPHQAQAIGLEWTIQCWAPVTCSWPWFAHPWVGALVDLALILAPGWAVGRSVSPRRWPGPIDAARVAGILLAAGGAAVVCWTIAMTQSYLDLRTVVPVAALGLVLGVARPWWPWLHVLFAALTAGFLGSTLQFLLWPDPGYPFADALPYMLEEMWPIIAVGLIGSAWQALAWVIRKLQERPFRLAIAVNVLNLVDALMTLVAVRSGGAYESNPVVRLVGLPAKVVLVGLLTWLLYRRKSSALVWPFAALLLVAGYHVAGMVVNGWR